MSSPASAQDPQDNPDHRALQRRIALGVLAGLSVFCFIAAFVVFIVFSSLPAAVQCVSRGCTPGVLFGVIGVVWLALTPLIAIGVLLAMTASGSLSYGGAVPASAQLRAEAEHLRATLASERDALARANARAEYALTHDAMTGLLNRHRMNSVLQDAIDAGGKSESGVALCFLDFDEFKKINDTYGHTAGDQFLRLMGDRLRRSLDCEDCIARVGGDEFAVVFENVSDVNDAIVFAKELLSEVAKPFIINGREVAVTASIGIAIWPLHVSDAHGLMFYADQAMYRAKQSGRNTYSVYTASPDGV